jgi:hypothetical protein
MEGLTGDHSFHLVSTLVSDFGPGPKVVACLFRRCAMQAVDYHVADKSPVVPGEYSSAEMNLVPHVNISVLVLFDDRLSQSAKAVFGALRSFLFWGKRECFPSINAICKRVGLSKKRVGALLKELDDFGLIKRKLKLGAVSRYVMAGLVESVYCDRNGCLTDYSLSLLLESGYGHTVKRIMDFRLMHCAMGNGHNSDISWQYNTGEVMPLRKCDSEVEFSSDRRVYDGLKASVDMITREEFLAKRAARKERNPEPGLEAELEALIESTVESFEAELEALIESGCEADCGASEWNEQEDDMAIQGQKVLREYESMKSRSRTAEEKRERARKLRAATPPTEEDLIIEEAKKEHRKSKLRLKDVCDFFDAVRQHKWPGAPAMTRDGKNLKNVRRLMDAFGPETTCDALEKIVESWEDIVERYGIDGPPTISVIKAFAESWFHEALVGKIEKKSAMERMHELGEYDAKNDNNTEVATFF